VTSLSLQYAVVGPESRLADDAAWSYDGGGLADLRSICICICTVVHVPTVCVNNSAAVFRLAVSSMPRILVPKR
jgi:hypothetical protein